MYSFLKGIPLRRLLSVELPAMAVAILLTEALCKFGSFTLELMAFMAMWAVGGFLLSKAFPSAGNKQLH